MCYSFIVAPIFSFHLFNHVNIPVFIIFFRLFFYDPKFTVIDSPVYCVCKFLFMVDLSTRCFIVLTENSSSTEFDFSMKLSCDQSDFPCASDWILAVIQLGPLLMCMPSSGCPQLMDSVHSVSKTSQSRSLGFYFFSFFFSYPKPRWGQMSVASSWLNDWMFFF